MSLADDLKYEDGLYDGSVELTDRVIINVDYKHLYEQICKFNASLDEKCAELEVENDRLKEKVVSLETTLQEYKSYVKQLEIDYDDKERELSS